MLDPRKLKTTFSKRKRKRSPIVTRSLPLKMSSVFAFNWDDSVCLSTLHQHWLAWWCFPQTVRLSWTLYITGSSPVQGFLYPSFRFPPELQELMQGHMILNVLYRSWQQIGKHFSVAFNSHLFNKHGALFQYVVKFYIERQQQPFISQKGPFLFNTARFKLEINFDHHVIRIWKKNLQGKMLRDRKKQGRSTRPKYKVGAYI